MNIKPYLLLCTEVTLNGPVISTLTNSQGIVITRLGIDLAGLGACFSFASTHCTQQWHLKLLRHLNFGIPTATLKNALDLDRCDTAECGKFCMWHFLHFFATIVTTECSSGINSFRQCTRYRPFCPVKNVLLFHRTWTWAPSFVQFRIESCERIPCAHFWCIVLRCEILWQSWNYKGIFKHYLTIDNFLLILFYLSPT